MKDGKVYVDKFRVSAKDLIKIAEMEEAVNKLSAKFMFTDISEDNLKYIAYETTMKARAICAGHRFLDMDNLFIYEFAFMKVKVSNKLGTVEIIPMFELKGGLMDESHS